MRWTPACAAQSSRQLHPVNITWPENWQKDYVAKLQKVPTLRALAERIRAGVGEVDELLFTVGGCLCVLVGGCRRGRDSLDWLRRLVEGQVVGVRPRDPTA